MLNRSGILIQAKFVHVSIQNSRSIANSLDANLLQELWGVSYVSVELIAHSWINVYVSVGGFVLYANGNNTWNALSSLDRRMKLPMFTELPENYYLLKLATAKLTLVRCIKYLWCQQCQWTVFSQILKFSTPFRKGLTANIAFSRADINDFTQYSSPAHITAAFYTSWQQAWSVLGCVWSLTKLCFCKPMLAETNHRSLLFSFFNDPLLITIVSNDQSLTNSVFQGQITDYHCLKWSITDYFSFSSDPSLITDVIFSGLYKV